MKRFRWIAVVGILFMLAIHGIAQNPPDKAYLQKLLDGWATGNPDGQTQYYAQGNYLFFDDSPLKYNNWDEYRKGTIEGFKDVAWSKIRMDDDAQIHCDAPNICWSAATVDMTFHTKDGKESHGVRRWTVIFEKQNDKWLIVHEHMSLPSN
ncbi:MAG TPA: nuclear transport factor 2 family protein [Candidatus Koribacter sp.]|jgi:ketosteroid isomerase-like protein